MIQPGAWFVIPVMLARIDNQRFPVLLLDGVLCQSELQRHVERLPPAMSSDDGAQIRSNDWSRLIAAVATRQDRAAFASLFAFFAPRIKTYMGRAGASDASAEELAQETMLTVWRKAGLFDPSTTGAAAWIFTIARNLRIDAARQERRSGVTRTVEAESEFLVDESPSPDERVSAAQSEQLVRTALARLSAEQIQVIELSFFQEKAHAEISKILGIPLGTVKSRVRLAMTRLRSLLGEIS